MSLPTEAKREPLQVSIGIEQPPRLRLMVSPGVHFVVADGEGIILDIVADRYYALTEVSTLIWCSFDDGLTEEEAAVELSSAFSIPIPRAREAISTQLLTWERHGLLHRRTSPDDEISLPRPRFIIPANDEVGQDVIEGARISMPAIAGLLLAQVVCRLYLATKGLPRTLGRLQRFRGDRSWRDHRSLVLRVLKSYYALRLPFSQGQDDCLIRSLVLMAVLRAIGVNAELCLGVTKFPFWAHAWVQCEETVINDTLETVTSYEPIARF